MTVKVRPFRLAYSLSCIALAGYWFGAWGAALVFLALCDLNDPKEAR